MAIVDTGEKIRELRMAAGFSQEQLAELSSLNRVTIAKYETGRIEPGAQALSRIADALDVSVDAILGKSASPADAFSRPKTHEARIVSGAMDKLPKEQREQVLKVVRAMLDKHPELFEEVDEDDPGSDDPPPPPTRTLMV